jgi:hypothetical protein
MLEINLNIMKMGFKMEKLIERFIILFVALMQVLDACLRKPRRDSKVRFSLLHFLVRDFSVRDFQVRDLQVLDFQVLDFQVLDF